MTQRLALHHILKNQLRDAWNENNEDKPNPKLAMTTKNEKALLRFAASPANPTARYFGDVRKTFDSMVANIRSTMKATPPPRKSVPSIPAPIAQIPVDSPKPLTKKRSKSAQGRIRGGSNRSGGGGIMPIAAIKASLDQKAQRLMKRGLLDSGSPKNFVNTRRIREVLQQKTMLENMLLQHKRLQRDRQTIALDIKRMRQDLDRIRHKLDSSLQNLNSTRTLFSATNSTISRRSINLAKPKPQSRPSTHKVSNSAATRRHSITASKSRINAPVLRSGNVTLKRQLAIAPPKTRRGRW